MRILVTGHEGFIGSRLYERLEGVRGVEVVGSERHNNPVTESLLAGLGPDMIVNLAATLHGNDPADLRNDAAAAAAVAAYAEDRGIHVFHASSIAAASPLFAVNSYAHRKSAQEGVFLGHPEEQTNHVTIARFNNVVGDGQQPPSLHGSFMHALDSGAPMVLHGDGLQRRSFIHVDGVVSRIIAWTGLVREGRHRQTIELEEWCGISMTAAEYVSEMEIAKGKRLAGGVVLDGDRSPGPTVPPESGPGWLKIRIATTLS